MPTQPEPADTPITANTILKWTGIVAFVVTAIASLIWFVAGLKSDIHDLKQSFEFNQRQQAVRDDQQDKQIVQHSEQIGKQSGISTEVLRRMDVMNALLERIDKKVGNP